MYACVCSTAYVGRQEDYMELLLSSTLIGFWGSNSGHRAIRLSWQVFLLTKPFHWAQKGIVDMWSDEVISTNTIFCCIIKIFFLTDVCKFL